MLEDSDWSSKAEVKLAMSGISPSLLHSIKLEQSAPVKELVAFLTLGDGGGRGRQRDVWFPLNPEAMSGISFKRGWVDFYEIFVKLMCSTMTGSLVGLLDTFKRDGKCSVICMYSPTIHVLANNGNNDSN